MPSICYMQSVLALRQWQYHFSRPNLRYLARAYSSGSRHTSSTTQLSRTSPTIEGLAAELETARANNTQILPLTLSYPTLNLDQSKGYAISNAVRQLRERVHDDVVVGRKIGFTNKDIWAEYNIDSSNWSYVYSTSVSDIPAAAAANITIHDDGAAEVNISRFSNLEPRIEPEIVLGLDSAPTSRMTDEEILGCVGWIAHGFEVVVSVFPGWKFTAPDTTAAFALHGMLLVGPRLHLSESVRGTSLLDRLARFQITLLRNGQEVDVGGGWKVLGSPIKAVRHLAALLEGDEGGNLPLAKGEMVTTGTLTKALPIGDHDVWETRLEGIELPGLRVKFRVKT